MAWQALIPTIIKTLIMASRPVKKAMKRFTGKMQTIFGQDGGKVVSALAMMAIGNYTSNALGGTSGAGSAGAAGSAGSSTGIIEAAAAAETTGAGRFLAFAKDFIPAYRQVSDATKGSDRGTPDMNIPQGGQDYTDVLPRSLGIANGFGYNFDGSIMDKATDIYGVSQGAGTKQSNDGTLSSWLDVGLNLYKIYSDQRSKQKAAEEEKQRQRREFYLQQLSGTEAATAPTTTTPAATAPTQYEIQPGDTLSEIAQANGMTVDQLLAANPQITDPNMIYAGQGLNIPSTPATMPPTTTTPPTTKKKDTVWDKIQKAGQKVLDAGMEGIEAGAREEGEDLITGEDPVPVAPISRGAYTPTPIMTPQQLQFQAAPYVQYAQEAAFDPNVYARYMTTVGSA